jgi:hypothetical protein
MTAAAEGRAQAFTEADGWLLLEQVATKNDAGISEWLNAHARSKHGLHSVLEMLPRWVASLSQVRRPLDVDEMAAVRFAEDTSPANRDAARAIAAAYNGDDDVLTGICLAVLESPAAHRDEVLQHEFAALSNALDMLRVPPTVEWDAR